MSWNEAMCGEMNTPEGYHNIADLVVKWNNELDQRKSAGEIS